MTKKHATTKTTLPNFDNHAFKRRSLKFVNGGFQFSGLVNDDDRAFASEWYFGEKHIDRPPRSETLVELSPQRRCATARALKNFK